MSFHRHTLEHWWRGYCRLWGWGRICRFWLSVFPFMFNFEQFCQRWPPRDSFRNFCFFIGLFHISVVVEVLVFPRSFLVNAGFHMIGLTSPWATFRLAAFAFVFVFICHFETKRASCTSGLLWGNVLFPGRTFFSVNAYGSFFVLPFFCAIHGHSKFWRHGSCSRVVGINICQLFFLVPHRSQFRSEFPSFCDIFCSFELQKKTTTMDWCVNQHFLVENYLAFRGHIK